MTLREITQGSYNAAEDAGGELFGGGVVHIPTFAEVVDALTDDPWKAPAAFRPLASLCGQQNSPFDSVIPFERLEVCLVASSAVILPVYLWIVRVKVD